MQIDLLKRHWEALAREDPMWAVLTEPTAKGGRWELEDFLNRGEHEVAGYLDELDRLGVTYATGRALDFGCGVGRLTQALARRFDRCDGVDISETMIEEARQINQHGDSCQYQVNSAPNLELFDGGAFDFVLSFIVLQHMEPRYAKAYISEFVRVLRPGGITLFQVPSRLSPPPPDALPDGAWRARISLLSKPPRQMRAGERCSLRVRVRNEGNAVWPADTRIRLGNHWLDPSGRVLVMDDGRIDLPGEVAPGQELMLELTVTAPTVTGRVRLELDLVQDLVGWFATRGSRTVRLPMTIKPDGREAPQVDTAFAARIDMYAVPREEVIATVEASGGEVLHALPDEAAGAAYEGFRYVVRRVSTVDPPIPRQSREKLDAALASIPDRWDMLPPVVSRHEGRRADLEVLLKRTISRALRWLTWAQSDYDRAVLRALSELRGVLEEQDAELRRLRRELVRLRERAEE